jgi:DNA-binding MurR/RpiR family transcriptional regulator
MIAEKRAISSDLPAPPLDHDELRSAIAIRRHSLSESMDRVATFILGHPEAVAFGTTATVAEGAQVAPSTLVRFAQSLGLAGFAEIQKIVRSEILRRVGKSGEPSPSVGYRHILRSIAEQSIRALESLGQSVTEKELSQFLDIIRGSETIFIVAEPRSFAAALAFRHMLAEKRQPSFLATHDAFDAEDILALTRPTDAIVEIDISSMRIHARKGDHRHSARSAAPPRGHLSASECRTNCCLKLPEYGLAEIAALALCQTIAACLMKAR